MVTGCWSLNHHHCFSINFFFPFCSLLSINSTKHSIKIHILIFLPKKIEIFFEFVIEAHTRRNKRKKCYISFIQILWAKTLARNTKPKSMKEVKETQCLFIQCTHKHIISFYFMCFNVCYCLLPD